MSLWTSAITPLAPAEAASQEDDEQNYALEQAKIAIQIDCRRRWKERWKHSKKGAHSRIIQPCLDPKVKKIHKSLKRHQSSLAIQLRTGKVGFRAFLFNRKVPDIETPVVLEVHRQETGDRSTRAPALPSMGRDERRVPQKRFEGRRHPSLKALLSTERGCRAATRMVQRTGSLRQYDLCTIEESWQEPAEPDPESDDEERIRG